MSKGQRIIRGTVPRQSTGIIVEEVSSQELALKDWEVAVPLRTTPKETLIEEKSGLSKR